MDLENSKNIFPGLFELYLQDRATPGQERAVLQQLNDPTHQSEAAEVLDRHLAVLPTDNVLTEERAALIFNLLVNKDGSHQSVHRVHFLKTTWFRYAAAIILLIGIAWYFQSNQWNSSDGSNKSTESKTLAEDIAPGTNKAILTLANGNKIILDSAANGDLANQGGVNIVKLASGQIIYDLRGLTSKEVMWNTMTTPNGGQYQVTLPDGTKAWLNAASSITFPTAFLGKKREVSINGEVYLEVATNKNQPFVVDIRGESFVEVLGTSFNINSYENENVIKTTLLEGSVKVINDKLKRSAILKPGQQAKIVRAETFNQGSQNTAGISVLGNIDLDQVLAWKNGLFNFNGADLRIVMRQLERWYNINVQYRNSVPDVVFEGKMYRNENLSYVLDMLKEEGVKFRLEGKNLIVF